MRWPLLVMVIFSLEQFVTSNAEFLQQLHELDTERSRIAEEHAILVHGKRRAVETSLGMGTWFGELCAKQPCKEQSFNPERSLHDPRRHREGSGSLAPLRVSQREEEFCEGY